MTLLIYILSAVLAFTYLIFKEWQRGLIYLKDVWLSFVASIIWPAILLIAIRTWFEENADLVVWRVKK